MKKFLKDNKAYFIAPIITTLIILTVYMIKGIFPFGAGSIVQADLGQAYIPVFYNMHDLLRNSNEILWNFCLGAGSNFYGSFVLNALWSPFTLIFGIIPRSQIINYVNILLIIKVTLMTLTSIFVYKKIFTKLEDKHYILFGVLYALSGYVLLSYHNIVWMDSLIMFPLFVLAMKHLMDTGDGKWFVITLAIELILSYYISFMILMMIVFVGALGIFFYVKKNLKKKFAMKLVLCTLLALAISAFAFLPSFTQSSASMRMSNVVTSSSLENPEIFTKATFYFCSALPVVLFIQMLYNTFKKDKKMFFFWLLTLLFVIAGLFIEPINKMWHAGSYSSFPYRYAFIPLFILIMGSLYNLNKYKVKTSEDKKFDIILCCMIGILFVLELVLTFIVAPTIMSYEISTGLYDPQVFYTIMALALGFIIMIIFALILKNKKIKTCIIYGLTLTQVLIMSVFFIGIDNQYIKSVEHKDEIIKLENKVAQDFNLNRDNQIDRYKDMTASFEENYAYILGVPTISSWMHIIAQEQHDLHFDLGYSTRYTRTQDLGGTLFSDSLYHIRYKFAKDSYEMSDEIYKLVESHDGLSLYENKTLPFGIINDGVELDAYKDPFSYQNMLYQKLFNKTDNIIESITPKYTEGSNTLEFSTKLNKNSHVYMYLNKSLAIANIMVNNNLITIPTIDNQDNTVYQARSNKGIVDLGEYSGTVKVEIVCLGEKRDIVKSKALFGYIENDKYKKFVNEGRPSTNVSTVGNKMTIEVTSDRDGYILIPETFNTGWTAKVNGKDVKIEEYMTNFMNVPVVKGENEIVMSFMPPRFKLSVIISLVSLIIFVLFIQLNKKFKLDDVKFIQYIFTGLAVILYIVFLYKIYIGVLF